MDNEIKNYINKRLTDLKEEKELWLFKLNQVEDETYKICYLETIAKMDELLDLLSRFGEQEWKKNLNI